MKNWVYHKNNKLLIDINVPVFLVSVVIILGFVLASFTFLQQISETVKASQGWIANKAGWFLYSQPT